MKTHFQTIPASFLRVLYFYDRSLRLWTAFVVDADENQVDRFETQYADGRDELVGALEFLVSLVTDEQVAESRRRREANAEDSRCYRPATYARQRLIDAVVDAADTIDGAIKWHAAILEAHGPADVREARKSWSHDIARHSIRIENAQRQEAR